jgi:predicted MPP superfamily phosphohydrolase
LLSVMTLLLVTTACYTHLIPSKTSVKRLLTERKQEGIRNHNMDEAEFYVVQLTDIHIGLYKSVERVQSAVNRINEMVKNKEKNIKLVFVTGDLTDGALREQYETCRKILDQLLVPYLPMLGNHDIWSYNRTWQEPIPTADVFFGKLFADKFKEAKLMFGDRFDYNNQSVSNPEHNNILSWFQNFELQMNDKLIFLALDWNSRRRWLSVLKGPWPGTELHNFTGGTFQWLETKLQQIQKKGYNDKKIVFLQHHPFRCPFYVPEFMYGFNQEEKDQIHSLLAKYLPIDRYWGHFAGHYHRWHEGPAFDDKEWQFFYQWESCACKVDGSFAVINFKNFNDIVSIEKVIAGPTN